MGWLSHSAHTEGSFSRLKNVDLVGPYRGEISSRVAAELALLAKQNAANLLADARLLYEHGRFARSAALAILAIEEISKHSIVPGAYIANHTPSQWKSFWNGIRDHTPKFVVSLAMESLLRLKTVPSDTPETIENSLWLKNECLYVDVDATGRSVISPQTHSGMQEKCAELLRIAQSLIDSFYRHPDIPLDEWAAHLELIKKRPSKLQET